MDMWNIKSVNDGMDTIGKVETGWNFVFGDLNGDIGYQMTGHVPKRRDGISGFVPLPGWKKENNWQGILSHKELPRIKNPKEGYFATAGSTSSGAVWQRLAKLGTAPMAMLFSRPIDPLAAGGLIIADIWAGKRIVTVDQLGDAFLDAVEEGDFIEALASGHVTVYKNKE